MIRNSKSFRTLRRLVLLVGFIIYPGQFGAAQIGNFQSATPQPSARRTGGASFPNPAVGQSQVQLQSQVLGSVPTGEATTAVLPLSLKDAIDRGLKYNLGLLESEQSTRASRAARLQSLKNLLPDVSANITESAQQVNLAVFGIKFPGVPRIVGPFGVADARGYLSQSIFNWSDLRNLRSASENLKASEYSNRSTRDLVVLAVGNAYLQVIASAALVDSARAQVKTAQSLHQKAIDQKKAGVIAGIDELRAQVELQVQRQRFIAQENQLAKDKLSLARIIGLPLGQELMLTDTIPYAPLAGVGLVEALTRAYSSRSDYQSAKALVRAAELARQGAVAERYPSLSFSTNYGDIGPTFGSSHGTFTVAGTLNIPIFEGGKVRADILQADAALAQRRAELEDLRGRIDYEVRTAFLDLKSAADQVEVAKSNVDLAGQTLIQAQDRFAAGVTDNIEVVQAQESVAAANQAYIAGLYTHNLAKVSLARAVGIAEQAVREYLGGK